MTVYKLHAFVCNQIVTLVTNVTSKVQTSNNTMWIISKIFHVGANIYCENWSPKNHRHKN